jgi:hypothetical protein
MDAGFKLEHVLRHLIHTEPHIEHWEEMIDSRSTVVEGVLVNAGSFDNSVNRMLSGLVLAVHLLAKKCADLEKRCQSLEMAPREMVPPRDRPKA